MASSGKYIINSYSGTPALTFEVNWSETYYASTNKHRITIDSMRVSEGDVFGWPRGTVSINGTVVFNFDATSGNYFINTSSNRNIVLDSDKTKTATGYVDIPGSSSSGVTVTISIGGNDGYGLSFYNTGHSAFIKGSQNVETIYTLSVNAGTGSTITVNRTTAVHNSGTGAIPNGTKIYGGDVLTISFAAASNYQLLTHTVNGASFNSGGTKNVDGNVSVASTAQPLASDVAATDANIGSVSTITVTKHSSSYYHSLQYSFGSSSPVTGYITATGSTSTTEVKYTDTSVPFTVPTSFYAKIQNSKTGTCTITCRTYASASSTSTLGSPKTCTFTVTASSQTSSPSVSGTVEDINATTIALTGDSSILIKYRSTARATITATAKNSATISSKSINNVALGTSATYRDFSNTEATQYVFTATDSRGYSASATVSPTVIAYIPLTLNITLGRPSPTADSIQLSFDGNYFNGSFGSANNSLSVQYRYKEQSASSFSGWVTVDVSSYIHNGYYTTGGAIDLGSSFPYNISYGFEVRAVDALSTVTKQYTVQKGTPVFDWGENDFNFNVPVYAPQMSINGIDVIPASGTSGGATYCKFPDGTMIEWGLASITSGTFINTNTGTTGMWDLSCNFTFPVSFVAGSSPRVFGSAKYSTGHIIPVGFFGSSATTAACELYDFYQRIPSASEPYYIEWTAVGRWK